jgi:GntR family transcriptional regulator
MNALDRSSPLPLYAQVKRRLHTMIVAWPAADDRFHTDQELQQLFGVSRATVRQALAELEAEGLLRRKQGHGTFVNRHKIEESFAARTDFSGQWAQSGRTLSVAELHVGEVACPPEFASALRLKTGARVLRIERLRLSSGMRIASDLRFIPMALAADIPLKEFERISFLGVISQRAVVEHGDTQIEASLAGAGYSARLQIEASAPILIRTMTYFSITGEPVMTGVSVYRADQVRYSFSAPLQLPGTSVQSNVQVKAATPGHIPDPQTESL